jgi:hypothetical protein
MLIVALSTQTRFTQPFSLRTIMMAYEQEALASSHAHA